METIMKALAEKIENLQQEVATYRYLMEQLEKENAALHEQLGTKVSNGVYKIEES